MHLEELDYSLPKELIADRPVEPRDSCHLLVVHRQTGQIEHCHFRDLKDYLQKGDLIMLNSARVTPARLIAQILPDKKKILEILVIDAGGSRFCKALLSKSRGIRSGDRLAVAGTNQSMIIRGRDENENWNLELEGEGTWDELVRAEGRMPLPPYILKLRQNRSDMPEDRVWYQTTFGNRDGAIAAPTAGLHFSEEMMSDLKNQGIEIKSLFLKVGIGTFLPVRTPTLEEHVMHAEEYEIGPEVSDKIKTVRNRGHRLVGVGTTVVRALESSVLENGDVHAGRGETRLLIQPGHAFRVVDALITNFHLPKTTLLALVYAFGGESLIRKAYCEAIEEKYRFFSYGDAMLVL